MLNDLEFAEEDMTQPADFIKDERMKADFTAFLNAETQEEQDRIIKDYNQWFAGLSEEEQAKVISVRMESMRRFLGGAQTNLEELDASIIKKKLGEMQVLEGNNNRSLLK